MVVVLHVRPQPYLAVSEFRMTPISADTSRSMFLEKGDERESGQNLRDRLRLARPRAVKVASARAIDKPQGPN